VHLKKAYDKRTGRTYLSIIHGYRDSEGKSRAKTVQSLGYLDELSMEYADPIAHFTAVVRAMESERLSSKSITVTLDLNERLEIGAVNRKNYGSVVFSKVYHELEIDRFLNNARRHERFTFNSESIMRLMIYTRLIYPGSKRESFLRKDQFFERFDFGIDDVYNALTHFDKIAEKLQQHLHEKIVAQYGRKTDLIYYDVTNYYFETDKQDDTRKRGCSKEKRRDPIIQMGLLMDTASLPIAYKLFPGNTHDSQTLMPILSEVKKRFGTKRIIVVADKGLNSGDNIIFNTALGDGYIYSKSVRGASKDFKAWILDDRGYQSQEDSYKRKSKLVPDAQVCYTSEEIGKNGKPKKKYISVEQKWIAFYSRKYAQRAKHRREDAIAKALQLIKEPAKYRRNCDFGAAGYIKNIKLDKETGEILNIEETLLLDEGKISEEEELDGYYAIITSELDDADEHIIEMYQGLWRIEQSFMVTKSILETRPIYLRTKEHINAHFLICFISLLIARIVERRLNGKYTIERIVETLQMVACSHLKENIWLLDFADDLTDELNVVFGTELGKKYMTLQSIKNALALSKL
jgi:transposase